MSAPDTTKTPVCAVCWYEGLGRHRCESGWVIMLPDGRRVPIREKKS